LPKAISVRRMMAGLLRICAFGLLATASSEQCDDAGSLLQTKHERSDWGLPQCIGVNAGINVVKGQIDDAIQKAINDQIPFSESVNFSSPMAAYGVVLKGCDAKMSSATGQINSVTMDPSDLSITCTNGQLSSTLTLEVTVQIPELQMGSSIYGTLEKTCESFPWAPVKTITTLYDLSYTVKGASAKTTVEGTINLNPPGFDMTKANSATVAFGSVEDVSCLLVEKRLGAEAAANCSEALASSMADRIKDVEGLVNMAMSKILPDLPDILNR